MPTYQTKNIRWNEQTFPYKDYCLLECDRLYSGGHLLIPWRNMLPQFSYSDDKGSTFLLKYRWIFTRLHSVISQRTVIGRFTV
jgi:hypothetical protein